jgi:6-phosphogluconolactonase
MGMKMTISKDIDELSSRFAQWFVLYMKETLSKQDRFTIALSGGSTPKKLYQLLASDEYKNQVDWNKIHFFWGDERYVPFDDERSNARMAFESLLDHVPVVPQQLHVIKTDINPQDSAAAYEKLLHSYFDGMPHTFDLVLLGLGDNAHTLSLFPGYDIIIREQQKWVVAFYLKQQEMYRITLTPPVVNQAARVVYLVSGGDKAAAVYHILTGEHDPDLYPAQIIQPFNSELYWFCDNAAAADL